MHSFAQAHSNMIKSQMLTMHALEPRIIEAFTHTPRHAFVPKEQQSIAYCDRSIALDGHNRALLPAALQATLLQAAAIKPTDNVLDAGCLSGYSTALLSHLARKVVAIEPNKSLASKAHTLLQKLHIANIIVLQRAITDGHADCAPYQVIMIHSILPEIPGALLEQLDEGGRLIALIQKPNEITKAMLATKHHHTINFRVITELKSTGY